MDINKDIKNLTEIIDLTREDIEKNNKNATAILDIVDLKSLRNVLKNNIPKQLIQDKIDELIKKGDYLSENNPNGRIHFVKELIDYQIEILQELFKEDKNV